MWFSGTFSVAAANPHLLPFTPIPAYILWERGQALWPIKLSCHLGCLLLIRVVNVSPGFSSLDPAACSCVLCGTGDDNGPCAWDPVRMGETWPAGLLASSPPLPSPSLLSLPLSFPSSSTLPLPSPSFIFPSSGKYINNK